MSVVHLLRHGEVHNPDGVLYGRMAGYHLSDTGQRMAKQVAEALAQRDIGYLVSSPLERALETAEPVAASLGLPVHTDSRVIEATNVFEGSRFGVGDGALSHPSVWRHLWNPFRPSWGEPYGQVAARMMAACYDAHEAAAGHEALLVSHQLPIWVTRLYAEGRWFLHDPRSRKCGLASLTSLSLDGDRVCCVGYVEHGGGAGVVG